MWWRSLWTLPFVPQDLMIIGAPGTSYWMGSLVVYNPSRNMISAYIADEKGSVNFGSYLGRWDTYYFFCCVCPVVYFSKTLCSFRRCCFWLCCCSWMDGWWDFRQVVAAAVHKHLTSVIVLCVLAPAAPQTVVTLSFPLHLTVRSTRAVTFEEMRTEKTGVFSLCISYLSQFRPNLRLYGKLFLVTVAADLFLKLKLIGNSS